MTLQMKAVLVTAAMALLALPAIAVATGSPNYAPEPPTHEHAPKGHAYGYYCKEESRKHVKGTPGTPFSTCVKGVAQMQKEKHENETQS